MMTVYEVIFAAITALACIGCLHCLFQLNQGLSSILASMQETLEKIERNGKGKLKR